MSAGAQALGRAGSRWTKAATTDGANPHRLRKAGRIARTGRRGLQARLAEHRVDHATQFINMVLWERWVGPSGSSANGEDTPRPPA
jgi:hypothetical protein